MIRERYKWYISIVSMVLAVTLCAGTVISSKRISTENKTVYAEKTLSEVLDKDSITDISIDIDESDWQWLLENATDEEYRSCNITINGTTYYNVGIRPKGNTSLTNVASDDTTDRYSFKIKFNEYVSGQTYNGMKSIVLNNIIQDSTYMKEYITYDLYSSLGVATPEMSYSNITINNETWGLYLAIEVIDERYLENNFGTTEGNLYKPETMGVNNKGGDNKGGMGNPPDMKDGMNVGAPGEKQEGQQMQHGNPEETTTTENEAVQNKDESKSNAENNRGNKGGGPGGGRPTEGADFIYIDDDVSSYSIVRDSAVFKRTTDDDFKRVINMYKNLNDGTNLEEVLDVEEVLKYFAVNTFVINLDSYSGSMYHNYYLYENNGKCQILPWDLNLSFGGYGANKGGMGQGGENSSQGSGTINFPIDNPVSGDLSNMPLIGKLLEVDEYKELYHTYLQQIADEYFNSGYYENLVNKLDTMISEYVKADPTAFCTYDEYKTAVSEMINFGKDRTTSVLAQLNGDQPSTTYGNIESTVNISALGDMGGGGKQMSDKNNRGNKNEPVDMPGNNEMTAESNSQQNDVPENQAQSQQDNNTEIQKQGEETKNVNVGARPDERTQTNNKEYYYILCGTAILGILSVLGVSKFSRKKYLK
ncbi:MAG: CotH kinase family protein [Clostridium sp.]|nr:CotH kinase family protein [Clostridium sp.]